MKISLQKYPAYIDSGVEWLGEIPSNWEVTKLRNIGVFSASGIDKYLKINESKVKIINFTDIYANKSMTLDSSFDYMVVTTPESNRSKHLVKKGDLIFLPSSETYEDLGAAALVNEELENTSFSYHVIRLVFQKEIEHAFRKYLTNNAFVLNQFSRQGKGSTRKIIGRGVFKDVQVIIPPLPEQTAIAAFLDRKTALIDQAIDIKQKQIELLKERRQILIHKAVTRGLNPNVKMKDSGVEWIGEIPEGWEVKRLKNSTRIFRGKFTHRPRNDERLYDGNYPFFQTGDVAKAGKYLSEYKQTLNDFGLRVSTLFPKGTIVITIAANIGDISILDINACFPDSIVGFEPMDFIERDFLYNSLLVMKEQFMSSTIKNTQMNLNVDRIGTNSIAIPTLKEQVEIIKHIEIASTKIDTAISLKEQEIEMLKEYKATLINSAVTGKVKVV
ncbi:MAG: restriction endonuclease subunit S [Chitinophagaceae bacterium]